MRCQRDYRKRGRCRGRAKRYILEGCAKIYFEKCVIDLFQIQYRITNTDNYIRIKLELYIILIDIINLADNFFPSWQVEINDRVKYLYNNKFSRLSYIEIHSI